MMPLTDPETLARVGAQLRARRQALGMTLDELSAATTIRMRYLNAIECGEPDKIPGETYLKGFVRLYAERIGLDADTLLRDAKPDEPAAPAAPRAAAGPRRQRGRGGRPVRQAPPAAQDAPSRSNPPQRHDPPGSQDDPRRSDPPQRHDPPGSQGGPSRSDPPQRHDPPGSQDGPRRWNPPHRHDPPAPGKAPGPWERQDRPGRRARRGRPEQLGRRARRGRHPTRRTWIAGGLLVAALAAFVLATRHGPVRATRAETVATHRSATVAAPPAPPAVTPLTVEPVGIAGGVVSYRVSGASAITVQAHTVGRCWVAVRADGKPILTRTLPSGQHATWRAQHDLRVDVGDFATIRLTVDGIPLGALHYRSPSTLDFHLATAVSAVSG